MTGACLDVCPANVDDDEVDPWSRGRAILEQVEHVLNGDAVRTGHGTRQVGEPARWSGGRGRGHVSKVMVVGGPRTRAMRHRQKKGRGLGDPPGQQRPCNRQETAELVTVCRGRRRGCQKLC